MAEQNQIDIPSPGDLVHIHDYALPKSNMKGPFRVFAVSHRNGNEIVIVTSEGWKPYSNSLLITKYLGLDPCKCAGEFGFWIVPLKDIAEVISGAAERKTMFKCGQRVTITGNKTIYEIASVCDKTNRSLICLGFNPVNPTGGSPWFREETFEPLNLNPKYLNRGFSFQWINNEHLEIIKDNMIDKLKDSGKDLAKAAMHGMAVGAATEGADYAYLMACNYLHSQFGVSQERLRDPVNRELITTATVAILHLASACLQDKLPGMDKVQAGCSLIIEGKAKDNTAALLRMAGPMLMHVSNLMDPDKALERITKQVQDGLKENGIVDNPLGRFADLELDHGSVRAPVVDEIHLAEEAEAAKETACVSSL